MFTLVKKNQNTLANCYNEKPGLGDLCKLKGSIGFLSGDFVCAEPTPNIQQYCCYSVEINNPKAQLGGLFLLLLLALLWLWKKWLFFWVAFFLCSQTITLKVDHINTIPRSAHVIAKKKRSFFQ